MKIRVKRKPMLGDTMSFTFDFGTKVAGSSAECPIKIYRCYSPTIQPPTNINSDPSLGFAEVGSGSQAALDLLKSQDGSVWTPSTSINTQYCQVLIELDLSPNCNSSFGGSNSALKSAMKAFYVDVWANASGSNSGVTAYNCTVKMWRESGSAWDAFAITNTTNSIAKITNSVGGAGNVYITSANKVFILIQPLYPSNGTIASLISLDYIKVQVDFTRTPDTTNNPPIINLPQYWAVLVRGFAPAWDNTQSALKELFTIGSSGSNSYQLYYQSGKFNFYKQLSGVATTLAGNSQTFSKFQTYNFLVQQTSSGMKFSLLKNNGTYETYSNTVTTTLTGNQPFYALSYLSAGYNADAFVESMQIINITSKPTGYDDTTAEAMLRGTLSGYEQIELFDINKVALGANTTRVGNKIIIDAPNASWYTSYLQVPVLPSNKYNLIGTVVGSSSSYIQFRYSYNNIVLGYSTTNVTTNNKSITAITPPNCNMITIFITNGNVAGRTEFSDISVKLLM